MKERIMKLVVKLNQLVVKEAGLYPSIPCVYQPKMPEECKEYLRLQNQKR